MRNCITLSALSVVLLLGACKQSGMKQYESLLAREQNSSKRTDSLFLGISLGMNQKDFFGHCWQLNKEGILTDGNSNTAILYRLHGGELKHPASMTFYPDFVDGRIVRLQANFRYDGWAPWNTHLQADQLQQEVLALYRKWYPSGNPFIRVEDPNRGVIYVKVDNNRRITIGRYDDMNVKVDYTDLRVKGK